MFTDAEKTLNEDGYTKKDFIIVKLVEYVIDAKDYAEVAATEETAATTEG